MAVEKMSVSFDPELGEAIKTAAEDDGETVSGWLAAAARDRLRLAAIGRAVDEWEIVHGPLTDDELAKARRVLDRTSKRTK